MLIALGPMEAQLAMTTYATEAEPFNETEAADLAAELLGVTNDRELDQFLGGLLRRAAATVGGALGSPLLLPLGGLVKGAVRSILPGVGRALSGFAGSAARNQIGQLASRASRLLGIELEGLSAEDQEFAAAKQLVRLAGTAAAEAALNPLAGHRGDVAKQALIQAAQAYAPGLVRSAPTHHSHSHSHQHAGHDCGCGGSCGGCGGGAAGKPGSGSRAPASSGSWVRRGRTIILEGF
jgi:hypothetical protein